MAVKAPKNRCSKKTAKMSQGNRESQQHRHNDVGWALPSRLGEKGFFSPFTFFYRTLGGDGAGEVGDRFWPSGAVMKLVTGRSTVPELTPE